MNLQVSKNTGNVSCLLSVWAKELLADHVYLRCYEHNFPQIPGADKTLARPGRKQAETVKSVMGRGMD